MNNNSYRVVKMGQFFFPQYKMFGFMWVNFTDQFENDVKYYSKIDADNYICRVV